MKYLNIFPSPFYSESLFFYFLHFLLINKLLLLGGSNLFSQPLNFGSHQLVIFTLLAFQNMMTTITVHINKIQDIVFLWLY